MLHRAFHFALLLLLAATARAAELPPALQGVRRILFLGDSITFGGGHIDLFEATLLTRYPDHRIEVLNLGLGSETASGQSEPDHPFPRPCVHERLDKALAETKPDLVFACYGMNDGIYYPLNDVRMKAYQDGMSKLVEKAKATGARVIVLTPPPFDATRVKNAAPAGKDAYGYKQPFAEYDSVLAAFSDWLLTQRNERGWTVIDVHGPLAKYLADQRKADPKYFMAGDGVHPNAAGYELIARQLVEGVGMRDTDFKAIDAELLKLVQQRQRLFRDAYLAKVGSSHPGLPKGPTLEVARERGKGLTEQIEQRLKH